MVVSGQQYDTHDRPERSKRLNNVGMDVSVCVLAVLTNAYVNPFPEICRVTG